MLVSQNAHEEHESMHTPGRLISDQHNNNYLSPLANAQYVLPNIKKLQGNNNAGIGHRITQILLLYESSPINYSGFIKSSPNCKLKTYLFIAKCRKFTSREMISVRGSLGNSRTNEWSQFRSSSFNLTLTFSLELWFSNPSVTESSDTAVATAGGGDPNDILVEINRVVVALWVSVRCHLYAWINPVMKSSQVYGCSWIALVGLIFLFKICTFSQKILVNFQLIFHFVQGVTFMLALAGITDVVVYTGLIVTDICVAWNPVLKRVGLWKSVRSLGLLYDADLHLYCRMFVVPIHLNVPNMPNVQPSVQPRHHELEKSKPALSGTVAVTEA
ncbi:hypothetical protein Ccrd_021511 [Cynara cardunculus var. scolymus]|uniref:Uncharacterized protein n=1 Tax=Cynara cardunculus var. scolymus TaxID=59895 RepID=A0A103Y0G9_CYNCS|nr:hypothetical protein Ccrd_021511 [Cynara cardunculus var. scolymus]